MESLEALTNMDGAIFSGDVNMRREEPGWEGLNMIIIYWLQIPFKDCSKQIYSVLEIKVPFSIKYFMSGATLYGMRTLDGILGIPSSSKLTLLKYRWIFRDTIIIKADDEDFQPNFPFLEWHPLSRKHV